MVKYRQEPGPQRAVITMAKLSKKQLDGFKEFMDGIDTSYWVRNLVIALMDAGYLHDDEIRFDLETLQKVEDFLFDVADGKIKTRVGHNSGPARVVQDREAGRYGESVGRG